MRANVSDGKTSTRNLYYAQELSMLRHWPYVKIRGRLTEASYGSPTCADPAAAAEPEDSASTLMGEESKSPFSGHSL